MYSKENSEIISKHFNDYFMNISSDLLKKIKQNQKETQGNNQLTMKNNYSPNKPFFDNFHSINEQEIINCVIELKNRSLSGIDGITVEILKENISFLVFPLEYMFNLFLSQSIIPDVFKLSIVTPIHKKRNSNSINNFRPISIISNIAKIFEKIIKKNLVTFLENNNLFHFSSRQRN
jgi:hypothetical protein